MSTAGHESAPDAAASDLAGTLASAAFVRLVSAPDGDALAATGVLARALDARGTPFQASVAGPFEDPTRATDADATVAVGHGGPADATLSGTASRVASETVRELGATPDHLLAAAGVVAAGEAPGSLAEAAGLDRRPGVAVPTTDLADGLAHSTLVHAPVSGDRDGAAALLADLDTEGEEGHRRVASALALAVAGDDAATERATEAVERALRPHVGGPVETLGGYADVLDAVARQRPGTGVALALGHDAHGAALDAWREHASAAHRGLRGATTSRYDGLLVVHTSGPVGTVARLAADFRSPEPVVLAVGDGRAAVRAVDDRDPAAPMRAAAEAADGAVAGRGDRLRARFADAEAFVTAFREAR